MNNNYYRSDAYTPTTPSYPTINKNLYENIQYAIDVLNSAKGKKVKIYMSFPDSIDWRDKIFEGILDGCGLDYILIKTNGNVPTLLEKIYINFIEFDDTFKY